MATRDRLQHDLSAKAPLSLPPLCRLQRPRSSEPQPLSARAFRDRRPTCRAFGEGRDVVTFPLVLSSTSSGQLRLNPETVAFNHWPGTLRVSVFVTCCGVSHDYTGQCQETLTHIIAGEPAPSGTQSQPRTVLLQGHGRLMLRMVLECDEGFYGPACNVPCGWIPQG
ncbi:uncharacterized protein LOC112564561 [Pomacea canaliculata]|uniref:uncharacterized protein LOC112564561 n=1 Tax=Pomacea canaliculata TaxID=400727 RepID=UPI000D73B2DF|nr:uncharacterized protein LOC112564561 [Pomacea canaliculata]